jgi:hypothetical protein
MILVSVEKEQLQLLDLHELVEDEEDVELVVDEFLALFEHVYFGLLVVLARAVVLEVVAEGDGEVSFLCGHFVQVYLLHNLRHTELSLQFYIVSLNTISLYLTTSRNIVFLQNGLICVEVILFS